MSIKIHMYLIVALAYLFFIEKLNVFILFYISILLHEMAHIVIALLLKVNVTEIFLMPVGVCAIYNEIINPYKEILISVAGPIISLIIALLSKDEFIKNINFIILIINLLPIYPLDGGRLLKNFCVLKYDYKKGIKISKYICDLAIIFLFVFSIISALYFKNYYLIIVFFYICTLFKKEMKKERILGLIKYLQNG